MAHFSVCSVGHSTRQLECCPHQSDLSVGEDGCVGLLGKESMLALRQVFLEGLEDYLFL